MIDLLKVLSDPKELSVQQHSRQLGAADLATMTVIDLQNCNIKVRGEMVTVSKRSDYNPLRTRPGEPTFCDQPTFEFRRREMLYYNIGDSRKMPDISALDFLQWTYEVLDSMYFNPVCSTLD